MLYEELSANLYTLLRQTNTLHIDQIKDFFRNNSEAKLSLDYLIERLSRERVFDYDERTGIVHFHQHGKIKDRYIGNYCKAFWILSAIGEDKIREIIMLPYPSQFMFVTDDNEVHDITVASSEPEVSLALRKFINSTPTGTNDLVEHILLLRSKSEYEKYKPYDFDTYVVLNRQNKPEIIDQK